MYIAASIIYILHVSLILFNIITPFITNDPFILILYCLTLITIIMHWAINNDTCILTKLESYFRGTEDTDTFMGRLIKPVYNISSDEVHMITILLFFYGFYKLRIWDKKRFELVKSKIINLYRQKLKAITKYFDIKYLQK